MDGNGRWAQKRGLARQHGHEQGARAAQDIILYTLELGIKYITLYAFSTENWRRPSYEIDAIMEILDGYLKNNSDELVKRNVRVVVIGNLERLSLNLKDSIQKVIQKTSHCNKLIVTLAISYGAWEEVVNACKQIALYSQSTNMDIDSIDEKILRKFLYANDIPDPDLLIRTGGEMRLSNFLLLQLSYSELYFCSTLWPDFNRKDFDLALSIYTQRERRFGSLLRE
jgi:undecaprenyl diphosphate synthase